MTILSAIPLWVWPLFVLLLVVGLRATRPRRAPVALFLALPLLGALSLRSLAALPAPGPAQVWTVWALALAAGGLAGYRLQRRWLIDRQGAFVTLRGEWLTLVVVMVIFWSNFVTGLLGAMAPDLAASPVFGTALALVLGLCAGSFAGRALRVLRA